MANIDHVLVVEGRFYEDIVDEMAAGAAAVLDDAGVTHQRLAVPGAFEVPAAIRFAIQGMEAGTGARFGGFVALGCIIRGETDHYNYICGETCRALMDLTTNPGIALGFGILTCDTREQAWARAAVEEGNKGAAAARACLRMMEVARGLRTAGR